MMQATGLVVLLLAGPQLLSAQKAHEEGASHSAHFHPNHLAAFVGATSELRGSKKTHFTLGADYVRRFGSSGRFGVGGFAEVIFHDPTEWLFGAAGYFFPTQALWVQAAGGVEFYKSGHGGDEPAETKTSFLLRFGAGYNVELPALTLTPVVLLDLVRDTEALVWGVGIGKGF
jgi:hypothetical protein